MMKYPFKSVFLFIMLIAGLSLKGYTQLIGTGLVEDPYRAEEKPTRTPANFRIQTAAAVTTYSDTLRLPFFEDFSGVVVSIDSLVISTSDNLVKVYDPSLNSYPDTTAIFIGFENPVFPTLTYTLSKNIWYIKQIASGEYSIDSSASLTTPMKVYATNINYQIAFWRLVNNPYSILVDTLKWKAGSNTYVNNRYPINPVSYNVATFDGLKSNGKPYSDVANYIGDGDYLTSQPINLSSFTDADSVYLSFYWQHTGIGESPDINDYLALQFKDTSGAWNTVRTILGNIPYVDTFKIDFVLISTPKYLFDNFQFRFLSHGRLSGPYDIWNLDYIYIDKNRTQTEPRIFDMTIGNASVSFLKKYTSMPYGQYFANKSAELGKLKFTTNNLDRNLTTNQVIQGVCFETTTPPNSYSYYYKDTASLHSTGNNIRTYQDSCFLALDSLQNQSLPMEVANKYYVGLNDTTNILHAYNNTYLTSTILWDYYAYDDGSPEWGVAANQSGAKVANKFTTNIQDTLTHIDIYFTKSKGPNMDGRSIILSVWNDNKVLVRDQAVSIKYGGYKRYKLANPFIISAGKNFYVGYQQNFGDLLTVGYDKNYDHSDKVYFNLGGTTWNVYNQQAGYTKGSMMIRPVFSKGQLLVTPIIEGEKEALEVTLYPVPTDDLLKIQGRVSEISLYDLAGRKLLTKTFNPYEEDKIIETSSISNGLYIVEIKISDKTFVKKIIIQHAY
jgi:hypothetical protein